MADTEIDHLVPDPQVAKELSITTMTIYRWDRNPAKAALGWPPKVKHGTKGRNYRHRRQLEAYKRNLLELALAKRGGE